MPVIEQYSAGEMARHRTLVCCEVMVDRETGAIVRIGDSERIDNALDRRFKKTGLIVCAACGRDHDIDGEPVCASCREELMAGGVA